MYLRTQKQGDERDWEGFYLYTLSLFNFAISASALRPTAEDGDEDGDVNHFVSHELDRKSTRLNSSHWE